MTIAPLKIYKNGSSFVVSIPRRFMTAVGLTAGDYILMQQVQEHLVMTPLANFTAARGKKLTITETTPEQVEQIS